MSGSSDAPTSKVGSTFRAFRAGAGIFARTLALRVAMSPSVLTRWEGGVRDISIAAYDKLSDYMGGRWAAN